MSTLRTVDISAFLFPNRQQRLLMMAPGDIAWFSPQCAMTLFLDTTDCGYRLRVEVIGSRYMYWAYLPAGQGADLFLFAGLVVFPRAVELTAGDRPRRWLMTFVDVTPNETSLLNQIKVAA